jgi:tape measure domain-containing protein
MPDPVVLQAHLDTGPTVPRINEAVRKMRELGSATDDVVKRFQKFLKTPGGGGAGRGGGPGRPVEDARKKLERLTKQTQLATRIAREHGTSVQAASRAVRAFGKDVSRAEAEASKYAVSLDRAQKEAKALAAEQRMAGTGGRSLTGTLANLQSAVGLLAGAAGFRAITAELERSIGAFIKMESVTRALTVATGGAAQGAEGLRFVRSEADRLGLSIEGTASEFGKLSAAAIGTKLEGAGVRDVFSAVSEASSVLGLSSDQSAGALLALGQIMSKGTVQAEELRGQLGERIPGAFQIMARGLNVTTQELGKMLEKGEVLAEEALPAFAAELRRAFGTDATTRIETTAATFARMETAIFDFRTEVGRLATQEGGLVDYVETLSSIIGGLTSFIQKLEAADNTLGPLSASMRSWEQVTSLAGSTLADLVIDAQNFFDFAGVFSDDAEAIADALRSWQQRSKGVADQSVITSTATERYSESTKTATSWAEKMDRAVKDVVAGMNAAERETKKLAAAQESAFKPLTSRLEELRLTAEIMRDMGVGATEAGEAARVQLASGMDTAAGRAIELQREIREAEQAIDSLRAAAGAKIALSLGQAPGQLQSIEFDPFAALDKPFRRGDTRAINVAEGVREIFDETESARLAAGRLDEQWLMVGETALIIADSIGGAWGDMIGGLVDGITGIRGAFRAIKESGGGLQGAMAGAEMGGMIGGLGQSFGLFQGQRGTSQFGGQLSGDFGDVGATVGGAIGGVFGPVGAVVGSVLGGVIGGAIKSGADEGLAQLRQVGDEVQVKITKDEGGLGDVVSQIGTSIAEAVESIESLIGGQIALGGLGEITGGEGISGEGVNLAIKIRDEVIAVFVNGLRREFETIEEAVQFGTLELLKGATLSGVSENVAAALKNTVAATFEELAADIQAAQMVDVRLMTEGEKFLMERNRLINDEKQALAGLGVSMQDWIDGLLKAENALARQAEQQALSLAGVDSGLEQSLRQLDAIQQQAEQTEALNAIYAAQAESATALAAQEQELAHQSTVAASEMVELGLGFRGFGNVAPQVRGQLRDLDATTIEVGESASIVAREIEGIDQALVQLSREAVVARGLGSFVQKVAEFTGNAELAAAAQELLFKAELITLQLEFARIDALGLLDDALRASIATVLEQAEMIGPALTAGGPRRGGGGRGQADDRARRRADIRDEFRELALEAGETREGIRGLQGSLRDFRETMREASEVGKIGADVMSQAWSDFIVVAARAATQGVQGSLDLFRGVSDLGGALASSSAEFDDARGQIWLLIQAAEEQGLSTGALVDAHRELVQAEQLAADVLVARGLADELAAVGVALDPEEIRKLAEFEFELARARAINAVLAAEEAGALERLGLDVASLLERIAGAELPEMASEDPAVRQRFDNLDDLMASLADGVEASIMRIADETATLLENATTLGAGLDQLAMIQGKGVEALLTLGESATSTVQAELDAAAGLDSFRIKLRQTDEKFADTAETLRLVISATRAAGGDVSGLVRDLNRLETAARVADREVARGLIDSFSQLGVALPVELTQALAAAEFEEARAKALATIATLDARGAFDALGVSAEELTARLIGATFGADGADATGAARSGGFSRGGGARRAGEDLSRLRQEVLDTIQAWTQEGLGDATRQAVGFAQALVDTRAKAERAGVALSLVDDAFDDLRRTFVDRQLADFEDGLSDVDRELSGINDRFTDILASFMVIGAEAEDFARAGEAFAASVIAVEDRLKEGIRGQLAELRGEDPTLTSRQIFEESQARFRDLAARAQLGDLEAVQELGPAAAEFRAQITSFLGGRGVVGVEALVGEITGALEAVEADELIPRDIAALEAAAASLASIDITTQAQPTATQTASGFSSVSGAVSDLDLSDITALISPEDLEALIDGLGAPEFSELITAIGALPISQLVDALGAQGLIDLTNALSSQTLIDLAGALGADILADLTVEFGPSALSELASTIGGLDIDLTTPDLDFGGIVSALGGIGTPLGDLVAAIGPEGFQAFIGALAPIAANTAAGAAGSVAVAQALTLEAEDKILGKLAGIRRATEGSEVGLRGQVWVKTWLSRQLDTAKDLNRQMNVPGYLTGGMVPTTGLAMLHAGERVLNPSQTRRFEDLGGLQMLDIPPVVIPPMPIPAEQSASRGGDDPVVAQLAALRREEGQRHQRETEMTGRQAASSSRQGQSLHEMMAESARLQAAILRELQRQAGRSGGVPGGVR